LNTVIAQEYQGTGTLRFLEFDLETATDLSAIDMDCMTISIATPDTLVTLPPGDSRVTMTWRHREDNDSLLETGDLATIRLDVRAIGIRAGDTFTVEINAAEGATASITRTVPTSIERDAFVELF
jgi:flagellin FlaB